MSQLQNLITRAMAGGGVGSLITLPKPCTSLLISVSGGGACWVRIQKVPYLGTNYTAPVAPVATPVPTAGNNATQGWEPVSGTDQVVCPPLLDGSTYSTVEVWEVTAGNIVVDGE
jgi:hypothetical protein